MTGSKQVKKQNELLRRELGTSPTGMGLYQWIFSEDPKLTVPMVLMTRDNPPRIIRDNHCICGVNVEIHFPGCKLTIPRPRWVRRRILLHNRNQWIFCKWVPPPSRKDWEESFGGDLPWPSEGNYLPVGDARKVISIVEGQEPFLQTTEMMIREIKELRSLSPQERKVKWEREDEEREKEKLSQLMDKVGDAFTFNLSEPGKKTDFSFGGIGASPHLAGADKFREKEV